MFGLGGGKPRPLASPKLPEPATTPTSSMEPAAEAPSAGAAQPTCGRPAYPAGADMVLDPDGRARARGLGSHAPPTPLGDDLEARGESQLALAGDVTDEAAAAAHASLPRTRGDDEPEPRLRGPRPGADVALSRGNGAPVADNNNTLTAGERGPALLQDVWLVEKLAHMDREVLPERRMHPKGAAAYGKFRVTKDITRFCKAALFSKVGKATDVLVRFSLAGSERGSPDDERDVRGFAVKFYTEQGNWDLVGNNSPVFFVRDALKFVDLNHAIRRDAISGLRLPLTKWDFFTSHVESLHQVTMQMSDRGIPFSYRHMHGFGVNTFSMINDKGERHWVKFHLATQQGVRNLTDSEARLAIGEDRDRLNRDLYEAIEHGDFPRWKMYIQAMPEADAAACPYNPFDVTKVWPHRDYPLIEVGELELDRNPDNFFAENEQSAFAPSNVVPGIGFSPDKLLQGRLFSYADAQRYRLGVNHFLIPVNAPRCPFKAFHRDGLMRTDGNLKGTPTYEPNRWGQWADQPAFDEPPLTVAGEQAVAHWNARADADFYSQPGNLFRLMSPAQRQHLFENTARELGGVTDEAIKLKHVRHCAMADVDYGRGVADALGLAFDPHAWDKDLAERIDAIIKQRDQALAGPRLVVKLEPGIVASTRAEAAPREVHEESKTAT